MSAAFCLLGRVLSPMWAYSHSSGRRFCQIVGSLFASVCTVSIVGKYVCIIFYGELLVCAYKFVECRPFPVVNLLGRSACWVTVSRGKLSYTNSVGCKVIPTIIHCHYSQCVVVTVSLNIHSVFHPGPLHGLLSLVYICAIISLLMFIVMCVSHYITILRVIPHVCPMCCCRSFLSCNFIKWSLVCGSLMVRSV